MIEEIKQLYKLTKKEAKKLRELLTEEEKNRLDFFSLKPCVVDSCIYGQATGYCFSPRATELINKSCENGYIFIDIQNNINLDPDGECSKRKWSPIEVFIFMDDNRVNGNNERLVNYIKGKSKSLKFV